ncbi:MAG: phosphotransferase, partial [bacterium]
MLAHAPRFDVPSVAQLARDLYGLSAVVHPLPSERDQNFMLDTAKGVRLVLKIANALEERRVLDAQQKAMAHLAQSLDVIPRVVNTLDGAPIAEVTAPDGRKHLVWAVTHLAGVPLAHVRRRTAMLLEDFGQRIGALSNAFTTFDHPAIHRDFHWDLANGRDVVDEYRGLIEDPALAAAIDVLVARFDQHVAALLPSLRTSAIHGDLNDHNVLVGGGDDIYSRRQRLTGVVDFGDMVHSYTVADLAIACAYVSLDADDPLDAIAHVVRGYHALFPLTGDELSALFGLIVLRLSTSACVAAHQRKLNPGNEYLDVSQESIRLALPELAKIPFGLAAAIFRDACGMEPVAAATTVRAWLAANTATFAPVIDADLRTDRCIVLDLGIGSPLVSGDDRQNREPGLTQRITALMRTDEVHTAIGRYDEPRLLYTSPLFATGPNPEDERRTLHIGLDLFADAGTPVYAPLDGVVHAVADNPARQDYGPVIVLRHATDDGVDFYTLYGHLSRESLDGLHEGKPIARGEQIATFGTADVNGGWTPHLHMQVMTDTLGLGADFPGVARASERRAWLSLSPDPNLIVGIPADRFPPKVESRGEALVHRQARIGGNVSIAYRDPVRAVRGWRQYLF